jgi:hypothetical protein
LHQETSHGDGAYLRVFCTKRSAMVVVGGAYLRVFYTKRSAVVAYLRESSWGWGLTLGCFAPAMVGVGAYLWVYSCWHGYQKHVIKPKSYLPLEECYHKFLTNYRGIHLLKNHNEPRWYRQPHWLMVNTHISLGL